MREAKPQLDEIPRLLIVIDEFASLARELPDFVTGLVNIAQRGRSLASICCLPPSVRAAWSRRKSAHI